jgi:hypothetical protein
VTTLAGMMAALTYEQEKARGIPSERRFVADKAPDDAADRERFSRPAGYELQPLPGSEFPAGLYLVIFLAYGWMLGAAWYAFGQDTGTDLLLAMATVLAVVFFAIPMAMRKTARPRIAAPQRSTAGRLRIATAHIETATGAMPAWHAWLEVLLIPVALAAAATLIGAAYLAS